jgi:aminopeptidase N
MLKRGFRNGLVMFALFATGAAFAEPRFSFHATPGKLPKEAVPTHYSLRLVPDLAKDRFEGRLEIEIDVAKPVKALTLNAANLTFASVVLAGANVQAKLTPSIDAVKETVTLSPAAGLIEAGRHRLQIDYSGPIGKHSQGLFQVPYKVREHGRLADKRMLATHFEPVHARKMFPSWDEPAFRATFDIAVEIDEGLTAVSNMPVVRETPLPRGKKEVVFARSVSMPTYLVALVVGELDSLQDEVDGIKLGIYTVKGKAGHAGFAMQATKEIVRYFNDYFGERYALPKLDQIALPGGFGGAMENWGAIIYIESRLALDPAESSLRLQQAIYSIVAHEIAHQWFGNLVTMAWWDNLWLNEAFASWMATKTAAKFHPQWRPELRRAGHLEYAMAEDARKTTHPVQTQVEDDSRAMDIFDAITYTKGEAFIYMLEGYLGENVFRDGVRQYMRAHRFSNTTTADLWHHLSQVSGRDVRSFAAQWTEQPGFPLVRVAHRCEGGEALITLSQQRFTLNDPQAAPLAWNVPVTLARGNEQRSIVLSDGQTELRFAGCEAVRAVGAGYYRVQYDDAGFNRLVETLGRLDASERLRLLADTFAFAQAGSADATRYLRLIDRLADETDRTVWEQVVESLRFLRELIDAPADRATFDRYAAGIFSRPFAVAGWDPRPGEDADMPGLRRLLIDALGRAGDPKVVAEARVRFAAREAKAIDPSIRPAVLNVVGRHADAAAFDSLLAMMRGATDVESKWQVQSALRQVADAKLQRRWMELLMTDELPPGEAVWNLNHVAAESENPEFAWQFIRANLAAVYAKASPRGRVYVLPETAAPFADPARADELLQLTKAHLDAGALYEAEKIADWIRLKAAIKAREQQRIVEWAKNQTFKK